jgi:hypothetical protein
MLDGLSACAYPDERKSGRRFKTFVREIGNWTDGERISLPQAALLFAGDPAMSASISTLLARWPWGEPQPITSDPFPHQLPANEDLWKVQHLNLLWQFTPTLKPVHSKTKYIFAPNSPQFQYITIPLTNLRP